MSDLKPCPFCGADDWRVGRHHASDVVSCGNCTGENSVDWWNNTRPIEDALRGDLESAKRRIAELESENASLTAERDHARQDAASVRLKLAEYQRPFTVMMEIPEQYNDGECSLNCPVSKQRFMASGWECNLGFMANGCPGPGCPRYKGKPTE